MRIKVTYVFEGKCPRALHLMRGIGLPLKLPSLMYKQAVGLFQS